MPAPAPAQQSGDQRRDEAAGVHRRAIDLEGGRAAPVLGAVERAHLGRQVGPEQARAQDQQQQRQKEGRVEGHAEMAEAHQHGPRHHRAGPARQPVADDPAEQGREGQQGDVEAEDHRGQGLRRQRPGGALHHAAEDREADHVLDAPRQQQLFDHVEGQERLHGLERQPLPELGPGQHQKAAGVAQHLARRVPGDVVGRHGAERSRTHRAWAREGRL